MPTHNELLLAVNQRIIEGARRDCERARNEERYLRWILKGGPRKRLQEIQHRLPFGLERRRQAAGMTP